VSRSIELLIQEKDRLLRTIDEAKERNQKLMESIKQNDANISKWRKQAAELEDDIITLNND